MNGQMVSGSLYPWHFFFFFFSSADFLADSCELEKADWISHYTTLDLSSNESGMDWMCVHESVCEICNSD